MEKIIQEIDFDFETVSPKEQSIYLKTLEKLERIIVLETTPNNKDKVSQVFIPSEIALKLLLDFHSELSELSKE